MPQQPLSLYIQLEEGRLANLEAVAKAALAFSEAAKEIAFILDPSMEVEICLLSGTEGSLDLNAFIRAVKEAIIPSDVAQQKARLRAVALGLAGFLIGGLASHTYDNLLDHIAGDDKTELTSADIQQIAEKTAEIIEKESGKHHMRAMVRSLASDPAVKGIGISQIHNAQPEFILPRSEFPRLTGEIIETPQEETKRAIDAEERVGLISPVLIPGSKRRWKIQTPFGEVGAAMVDAQFQDEITQGHLPIPLRSGIEMDVTIQISQEKHGEVWIPTEYKITKVHRIHSGPDQPDLILP